MDDARRAASQQRADFEAALARLDDQAGRVFDYFFAVARVGHTGFVEHGSRRRGTGRLENALCGSSLRCGARNRSQALRLMLGTTSMGLAVQFGCRRASKSGRIVLHEKAVLVSYRR